MSASMRRRALMWTIPLLGACAITGSAGWPGSSSSASADTTRSDANAIPNDQRGDTKSRAKVPADLTRPNNCDPRIEKRARELGTLKGVCWNPPGPQGAAEVVTVVPGRRQASPIAYWFDMPKEVMEKDGYVIIRPVEKHSDALDYEPYDGDEGLPPFTTPDLDGKTLAEAVDIVDKLDLPAILRITWDGYCEKPHGVVCRTRPKAGDPISANGAIEIKVSTDVLDAGTPKETLRLRDFTGKPTDQAVAALKKLGFVAVEVVEGNFSCERGVVCTMDPPTDRFYPRDEKIQLKVRRGKR